jgi:CheY-like chemotaxis protein
LTLFGTRRSQNQSDNPDPKPQGGESRKKTGHVLIVDDDHGIRVALRQVLEDEGYRVASATHGGEALEYLAKHRPCVIILDLQMPIVSGWDFAAEFAKNEEWAEIPIVVVSAYLANVSLPKQITPVACLAKPINLDELLAAISKACD